VNKAELVDLVARRTGVSKRQVRATLDAAFDEIAEGLARGARVTLGDLGTLEAVRRGPRQAINPQTRERIQVPEGARVRFRPAPRLKRAARATLSGDPDAELSGDPEEEY
jgi:DNA-binding protein HU-beta